MIHNRKLIIANNNRGNDHLRRIDMPSNKAEEKVAIQRNSGSIDMDPKEVKKEIQTDINHGEGAMTSREAGSMRQ